MARYSAGGTATIAGTSARPIFGLLNTAAVTALVREIGLYNTTTTECVFKLVKFTGGTAGADVTESPFRANGPASICQAKAGWTADTSAIDVDMGLRIGCPAAKEGGAILTFGENGLEHALGTTKGVGMIPVGTGQVVDWYVIWDE